MADDDLIRRGDALNAVLTTDFRHEAHDAIAALPAVTALTPKPVDDSLAADPAVKEWNAAIWAAANIADGYGSEACNPDMHRAILALLKREK